MVTAYDLSSGERVWEIGGVLTDMKRPLWPGGVSSDRHGHILVADTNNCCVIILTPGGAFLRTILQVITLVRGYSLRS